MELRFRVNQAEAFRQGINVPKSIVTVEVDATTISPEERNLLADRMDGIDVCTGYIDDEGRVRPMGRGDSRGYLVEAILPTYEALIEAVRKDNEKLKAQEK
jgi:hypothetical protein